MTNCRRCGGQETCMDYCEDYKNKHPNEDQVNCKSECSSIKGYKCILTPGGAQDPDGKMDVSAKIRAETNGQNYEKTHSSTSKSYSSNLLAWPIGLGALGSLVLGEYWYRNRNKNKNKQSSKTHQSIY